MDSDSFPVQIRSFGFFFFQKKGRPFRHQTSVSVPDPHVLPLPRTLGPHEPPPSFPKRCPGVRPVTSPSCPLLPSYRVDPCLGLRRRPPPFRGAPALDPTSGPAGVDQWSPPSLFPANPCLETSPLPLPSNPVLGAAHASPLLLPGCRPEPEGPGFRTGP